MQQDRQPGSQGGLPPQSQNEIRIGKLISTLLSYYWTGNEDERLRDAQADDWLNDLSQFSIQVVEWSCTEWRRGQTRRPTPADIYKLCLEYKDLRETPRPSSAPRIAPYKYPDDHVREDWRTQPIRTWTLAELKIANWELDALAEKYGFKNDRMGFVKASLRGECPTYDCVTGFESRFAKPVNVSIEPAKEIPAP